MILWLIGIFLIACGAVGAVGGAIVVVRLSRLRRRLSAKTPLPIAAAPHGQDVEIRGIVAASEQGLVTSPVSGRQVVLYRIEIGEAESKSTLHQEAARREFWLVDDSGARARILPERSELLLTRTEYGQWDGKMLGMDQGPKISKEMTPQILEWSTQFWRKSPVVVAEWDVAPGDRLSVTGRAERSPDGLRMRAHDAGKGDIVLSASDVATRSRTLGKHTSQMLVTLVLCLVLFGAGVACLWWASRG